MTDGFDDSDYDNELSTRQLLEELSKDPNLMAHPEAAWFPRLASGTDEKLRAVLSDQPVRLLDEVWSWSHLPTLAGAELATDPRELYGFEVERVV